MSFTKSKYFLIVVLLILAILLGGLAWWIGRPLAPINNDSSLAISNSKLKENLDNSLKPTNENTIYKEFEQNLIEDAEANSGLDTNELELFVAHRLSSGSKIYSVGRDFIDREPFVKLSNKPAVKIDDSLLSKTSYLFVDNGQKLQLISPDSQFYGEFTHNQTVYWFFGINKVTGTKEFYLSKQNLQEIQKLEVYKQDLVSEVKQIDGQTGVFEVSMYDTNGRGAKLSYQTVDLKTQID